MWRYLIFPLACVASSLHGIIFPYLFDIFDTFRSLIMEDNEVFGKVNMNNKNKNAFLTDFGVNNQPTNTW